MPLPGTGYYFGLRLIPANFRVLEVYTAIFITGKYLLIKMNFTLKNLF